MINSTVNTRTMTARPTSLLSRLAKGFALAHQRRTLANLDNDALRDLGISKTDALIEAKRPLWDAPAYWRN